MRASCAACASAACLFLSGCGTPFTASGTSDGGSADGPSPDAGPPLGDGNIEPHHDTMSAGVPQAFQYVAAANADIVTIAIYVDANNAATKVFAGIYSNGTAAPAQLLASTVIAPTSSAWNQGALDKTVSIQQGATYWIAALGTGGSLSMRDRFGQTSTQTSYPSASNMQVALPATFSVGMGINDGPMSAYAF